MLIKGKLGTYSVKWVKYGFSYAVPIVKSKKKIPLLPISLWRKVWEGEVRGLRAAEVMLPDYMEKWFQNSVDAYEKYKLAWENK